MSFVGRIGTDDLVLRSLEADGVDVSGVRRDEGESGVALILVDEEGETVIVVAPGANGRLAPADVSIDHADAVLCQLEIPLEAVVAAAEQASFFCLNAAPALPVPAELIRRADLVVVNRHELDALTEEPTLTALTLGAEGAVLLERGREIARASAAEGGRGRRDRRRRRLLRRSARLPPRGPGSRASVATGLRRRRSGRVAARRPAVAPDRRRARRARARMTIRRGLVTSLLALSLSACGGDSEPDANLGPQLLEAARAGDADEVRDLLERGAPVESRNPAGATPLVAAAYGNHLETARLLVDAGADVNVQDETQQSAYLIATSEVGDDPRLLELTLEHGAKVNAKDSYNGTGLIRAAERGYARSSAACSRPRSRSTTSTGSAGRRSSRRSSSATAAPSTPRSCGSSSPQAPTSISRTAAG